MNMDSTATIGRLVNLAVPGGGLILIGSEVIGVVVAVLFTVTANFAVAASLLFPDEVPPTWRGLGIGLAIGTYLGAQIRYAQSVRHERRQAAAGRRRAALREVRGALLAGRAEDAWQALQPLVAQAEDDLVVAYRLAQVLTVRGDQSAALAAWQRVRRLDRHRIYRHETEASEQALRDRAGAVTGQGSPGRLDA